MRLTGKPDEVYQCLEAFYNDNRKLRIRRSDGSFIIRKKKNIFLKLEYEISYMDVFVDDLLNNESFCDIILPRIPKRMVN